MNLIGYLPFNCLKSCFRGLSSFFGHVKAQFQPIVFYPQDFLSFQSIHSNFVDLRPGLYWRQSQVQKAFSGIHSWSDCRKCSCCLFPSSISSRTSCMLSDSSVPHTTAKSICLSNLFLNGSDCQSNSCLITLIAKRVIPLSCWIPSFLTSLFWTPSFSLQCGSFKLTAKCFVFVNWNCCLIFSCSLHTVCSTQKEYFSTYLIRWVSFSIWASLSQNSYDTSWDFSTIKFDYSRWKWILTHLFEYHLQ